MRRLLVALLLSSGCQNLIDLEDRHFVADEGAATGEIPSALECSRYCELMMGSSSQPARCNTIYASSEACRQTCLTFARGTIGDDPLDPTDGKRNTLACREAYAERAVPGAEDAATSCLNAGPGGNGVCGSNCESYCNLFAQACPDELEAQKLDLASCTQKCAALRDKPGLNAADGADHEGDTVQCRLVHASNSAAYAASNPNQANPHCGHASLRTTEFCVDAPSSASSCESYCSLLATACTGPQQLYENKQQCLKTCAALDPGRDPLDESTGNTVACRIYHGYNALLTSDSHCGHAGAGGWDAAHCGDECASYCRLAKAACGDAFSAKYAGIDPEASCREGCQPLLASEPAGYMGYTLASANAGGLPSKLYATVKSLETGDPTTCAQAL